MSGVQMSSILVPYSFEPHIQGDELLISSQLLDQLEAGLHDHNSLYVSVKPASTHTTQPGAIPSIICYAKVLESANRIAIPTQWASIYPHIFPHSQSSAKVATHIAIARVQPIFLTDVVVIALSSAAYDLAQHGALSDHLRDRQQILRCGDIIHLNESLFKSSNDGAQLASTSSSEQDERLKYRVDVTEPVQQGLINEYTRFIAVYEPESENGGEALLDAGEDTVHDATGEDESSGYETDSLEIDEAFLANGMDALDHLPSEVTFSSAPLPSVISAGEDEHTVYLRTVDLTKLGLLNGDWAIARPSQSSTRRLVRVQASSGLRIPAGTLLASPALLYNILGANASSSGADHAISLSAGPFRSHEPAIPTATSVVIARVASLATTTKAYADVWVESLRSHLGTSIHLFKQGDIIAVSLTAGQSQSSDHTGRSNEIAYFIVTNIECETKMNGYFYGSQDFYMSSTLGELGCWIDTNSTRINQSGVEHSWIPALGVYMELGPDHPTSLFSRVMIANKPKLLAPSSPYQKLWSIASALLAAGAMDYNLNLSVVLKGARGLGKFTIASWVAQKMGMHLVEVNCYNVIGHNEATTEGTLRARFDKAVECSPCIFVLRYIEAFAQSTQPLEPGKEPAIASALQDCINEAQSSWKMTGYPVLILGTTCEPERVPPNILSAFKHEVVFEAPTEPERYEIISAHMGNALLALDVSLSELALQTAGLVAGDLVSLVSRAKSISMERTVNAVNAPLADLVDAGICLTGADFASALSQSRTTYAQSIGAPSIPRVTWDDVGGLAHAKKDILDTIQLPLDHPELFGSGLKKRSGILLYGPPGTGKTLLAKAVATSCSLNFFSVKGPELLNMYIGESEANVRRVFQRARDAKPCVIFFDELDSIAPKRGNQGDSGGVMDRIVSQLLAELDGMSSGDGGADVFVIGATNRPDLLDPALLRPGRFDRMIYLGVSDTHEAQYKILEALTRKFRLDSSFHLRAFAEQCPFNFTGADFYALSSDALLNAMSRKANEVDKKLKVLNSNPPKAERQHHPWPLTPQYYLAEMASSEDISVLVTQEDFELSLKSLIPSVSVQEMEHYKTIQQRFSQGFEQPREERNAA